MKISMDECLLVAGLGMAVVLAALCILALFIVLFSKFITITVKSSPKTPTFACAPVAVAPAAVSFIAPGTVRLNNVKEKTAAMIMAIVSEESKIPLNELVFKSIKAVD